LGRLDLSGRQFDEIHVGVHARQQGLQRGITVRDVDHVLRTATRQYPGTSPNTFRVEGTDGSGRMIAIVYSELIDTRGRVAYIVTLFPIRRYRDDATVL